MTSRPRLWSATLVAGLVLAACGGDDDATTTPADSPTTTEAAEIADDPSHDDDHDDDHDHDADDHDHDHDDDHDHDADDHGQVDWPLVAPEPQLPVEIVDDTGQTVTITAVDRIGSLNGSVTEIIWTLGLGDRVVVIDSTTGYPEELTELPNVGFFRQISAEGVIAQLPDVLFAPVDAGPPEALDAIEAAGTVIVRMRPDGGDPAEIGQKTRLVGSALGLAEHAEALAADADARFEQASAAAPALPDDELVAYIVPRGQGVFLTPIDNPSNTHLAAAGATTVAAVLNLTEATPLTPEAIAAADPFAIVSTATAVAQAGGEEAFLAIPGIAETRAARLGNLIVWPDDQSIQQWTPRGYSTVNRLAELLAQLDR